MNLLIILVVLMLLFGGGGFYFGGPLVGGGGFGLILLICLILFFTGGFGSTFTYKRLALTMNFSFAKQMAINLVNGGPSAANGGTGATNIPLFVYQNSWSYPGQTNALYARGSTGFIVSGNVSSSNAGYSDASYLRFQTVTLSYSLPTKILGKIGVKGLSFNVSTNNLFVITAYKGLDPEVTTYGGLPPTRTVVSGLKISF